MTALSIIAIVLVVLYCINNSEYKKTEYYQQTKTDFLSVYMDKGRYGEYLTYKKLFNAVEGNKKFLLNCYIPKDNGETTEIDLIMIHATGIYVFESKNYSGWIFGKESNKQWTQTLPRGKRRTLKSHFLNPIMQNQLHLKWLQTYLKRNIPMYSFIVFSERCTLKDVTITSNNHYVLKRTNLIPTVAENISKSSIVLSDEEIDSLYNQLYALTQVSDDVKKAHVEQIKENIRTNSDETSIPAYSYQSDNNEISQGQQAPIEIAEPKEHICPRCGAKLVIRTAHKGTNTGNQFWGCSAFPKCRYTEKFK